MAANRICKVLKVNQDNERLMEEYERLASDVSNNKSDKFLINTANNLRLEDAHKAKTTQNCPQIKLELLWNHAWNHWKI